MAFGTENIITNNDEERIKKIEDRKKSLFVGGNPSKFPVLDKQRIVDLDTNLIDPDPDNDQIFNMRKIERLATSMDKYGFKGAVEVFQKPDGRYQLIAGHRRWLSNKKTGNPITPSIIFPAPENDADRVEQLLDSNLNNRDFTPLDYARAIRAYIDKVLTPRGQQNDSRKKCADYFGISETQIQRYLSILKMIPELQELAENPEFPYSAFTTAATLEKEDQHDLYKRVIKEREMNTDKYISKKRIEQMIISIKQEKNYKLTKKQREKILVEQQIKFDEELKQLESKEKDKKTIVDIEHMEPLEQLDSFNKPKVTVNLDKYVKPLPDMPTISATSDIHNPDLKHNPVEPLPILTDTLVHIQEQLLNIKNTDFEMGDKKEVKKYLLTMKKLLEEIEEKYN